MLSHFNDIELAEAEKILFEMRKIPYIKYIKQLNSYHLHDIVRDLILRYVWPQIDPNYSTRKSLYRNASHFYDFIIGDLEKEQKDLLSQEKNARIANNREIGIKNIRQLAVTKRKIKIFQAQQLYYSIMASYDTGITIYESLFERNLWNRDLEANELLEQELYLAHRALSIEYPKHKEMLFEAKTLIKIKYQFKEALNLLASSIDESGLKNDALYHSDILLYKGIAHVYIGEHEPAQTDMQEAIQIPQSFTAVS